MVPHVPSLFFVAQKPLHHREPTSELSHEFPTPKSNTKPPEEEEGCGGEREENWLLGLGFGELGGLGSRSIPMVGSWSSILLLLLVLVFGFVEQRARERGFLFWEIRKVMSFGLVSDWLVEDGVKKLRAFVVAVEMECDSMAVEEVGLVICRVKVERKKDGIRKRTNEMPL